MNAVGSIGPEDGISSFSTRASDGSSKLAQAPGLKDQIINHHAEATSKSSVSNKPGARGLVGNWDHGNGTISSAMAQQIQTRGLLHHADPPSSHLHHLLGRATSTSGRQLALVPVSIFHSLAYTVTEGKHRPYHDQHQGWLRPELVSASLPYQDDAISVWLAWRSAHRPPPTVASSSCCLIKANMQQPSVDSN